MNQPKRSFPRDKGQISRLGCREPRACMSWWRMFCFCFFSFFSQLEDFRHRSCWSEAREERCRIVSVLLHSSTLWPGFYWRSNEKVSIQLLKRASRHSSQPGVFKTLVVGIVYTDCNQQRAVCCRWEESVILSCGSFTNWKEPTGLVGELLSFVRLLFVEPVPLVHVGYYVRCGYLSFSHRWLMRKLATCSMLLNFIVYFGDNHREQCFFFYLMCQIVNVSDDIWESIQAQFVSSALQ